MQTDLTQFDATTSQAIVGMLAAQHEALAQWHRPRSQRSLTAVNYDSHLQALGSYMRFHGDTLPTRIVLERWRDDMDDGVILSARGEPYANKTINARLAAARKLLRGVAADTTNIQVKLVLESWSNIRDAKPISIQDYTESDYGTRLSQEALQQYISSPDTTTLLGNRDRLLLALLGGAGLRLTEAINLRVSDVRVQLGNHYGIRIRKGKHNKSRVVVLGDRDHWLFKVIDEWLNMMPIAAHEPLLWSFRRAKGDVYLKQKKLSARRAQQIVMQYPAWHEGEWITISAHDLRRTVAKLWRAAGMAWEAIQLNLGHKYLSTTQDYVGRDDIDYSLRVPAVVMSIER